MICSYQTVTINISNGITNFLTTIDRDGLELKILKEKPSDEVHRWYYCSNCKQTFQGESPEDWEVVKAHLGSKYEPPAKPWHDIDDSQIIDFHDTRVQPAIRRSLKMFREAAHA